MLWVSSVPACALGQVWISASSCVIAVRARGLHRGHLQPSKKHESFYRRVCPRRARDAKGHAPSHAHNGPGARELRKHRRSALS
jgi:hypothetical protein